MPRFKRISLCFFAAFAGWVNCYAQKDDAIQSLSEGNQFLYDGKYDSAIASFKDAKQAFEFINNAKGVIEAGYGIGEGMLNLGQCDTAIRTINEAIDLSAKEFGEVNGLTAEGYYVLSKAYGGCSNQPEKAIKILDKSIARNLEIHGKGSKPIARNFNMMGYFHNSDGNYDSALIYLNQSAAIWKDKGVADSLEYARTLSFIGEAKEHKGHLKEALLLATRALKIRQRHLIADHPTISNSLTDVGNIYKGMGNYDQALNHYLPALEIRKKTLGPDHVNVGGSYYTIGNLYGNLSNYQRAIQFIEQGNVIIKARYGEKLPVLHAYYAYLGRMYSYVGNYGEAEHFLNLSLNLAESNLRDNHPYLGTIYGILGDYYSKKGDDESQVEYLDKALVIYRKIYKTQTTSEAAALVKLGEVSLRNNDLKKAELYFNSGLEIYYQKVGKRNSGVAGVLQHLGDLNRKRGNPEEALELYINSIEAVSSDSINNEIFPEFNSLTNKYRALIGLKRIAGTYRDLYEESENIEFLKTSLNHYQVAVRLIDFIISGYRLEESKAQLGEDFRGIFEESVGICWQLYQLTGEEEYKRTAFHIVEKSKSPILLSRIEDVEAKRFNGVPDNLMAEERDLRVELSYYKKKLHDAKLSGNQTAIATNQKLVFDTQQAFEALKENLKNNYREYYNYKYDEGTIDPEEVRKRLMVESAVLEYFISDSSIFSFILSKENFEFVRLKLPSKFQQTLDNYHRSLTDNSLIVEEPEKADSLYIATAFQAFEVLIRPLIEKTDTPINRLIIVPDGKLSQVSFGTFLKERPSAGKFRYGSLSYLLKDYTVGYAYSATLNFRTISNASGFSFAGFAPSYVAEGYSEIDSSEHPMAFQLVRSGNLPLPGAISEVSVISNFLNGESWINQEASESNFKNNSGRYSVIHLAMHSLLNSQDPVYSELLFNNETDSLNDGYLTIDEIYNLELNADMIVLSACSSGSGIILTGEGPISFTRAFSYAGCPSVIMSMWKIPDAATSEIMIQFYKNIKSGDTKDMALKKAQLYYLEKTDNPLYQHPFFWGSFVAMGDTQPISTRSQTRVILAFAISAVVLIGFFRVRRKLHVINR
ncbi:MAG: CHAT domain-containing tetratricopeptide repeat protein [Cyclobacteriaceae bacterium]